MIDFRYHIVSIVAVFLALATGLVLGASLLNTQTIETLDSEVDKLNQDKDDLRAELDTLTGQRDSLEAFAGALSPLALRDRLVGERVVVVTLPGATDGEGQDLVDGVLADIQDNAGGEVVATIAITEAWVDAEQVDVLDGLAAQLTRDGIELPQGTAYDRAAVLLANALVGAERTGPADPLDPTVSPTTTPATTPPATTTPGTTAPVEPGDGVGDNAAATILEGLAAGGFVTYDERPARATVAVVVAPAAAAEDDRSETVNGAWTSLAVALDQVGGAAVVAGPPSAADGAGLLAAMRGDERADAVSTVDSAERPPGQVATVLALVAEIAGQSGAYGLVGDVDGPLPVLAGTG